MKSLSRKILVAFLIALFVCAFVSLLPAKDKITPAELVANHLKSIGPADKLAARKTCVAEGEGEIHQITGGTGMLRGSAQLISEGDKVRLFMKFNYPDYPSEQFVYDGKNFNAGYLKPGLRSKLGNFLYTYNFLVKEGLVGGVLSTAWPLEDLSARKPRLRYDGLKKIDGVELHELRYDARKGDSNVSVRLDFDPATFHHVRSIYKVTIPAQLSEAGIGDSANMGNIYLHMEERFDNFKEVDGLTVPMHWNIHLTFEGQTPSITEWDINFTKVTFNQPLTDQDFVIQ